MTARILTGSKREIAEKVADLDGEIREAIVFVEDATPLPTTVPETFADMEPFTVRQPSADDSRESIYRPLEGE